MDTHTHYCDLTGEPPFVREMIDRHHEAAVACGVKIVNCCGYDCVPVDLAVMMGLEEIQVQPVQPQKPQASPLSPLSSLSSPSSPSSFPSTSASSSAISSAASAASTTCTTTTTTVRAMFTKVNGLMSGGTAASAKLIMEWAKKADNQVRKKGETRRREEGRKYMREREREAR